VTDEEAAKLSDDAIRIIAGAILDMQHPSLTLQDCYGNARAILARLAQANILLERYDAKAEGELQ
jgi:hypothetical protein